MDEKVAKTPRPHMLDADEVAELLRIKKGSAYEVIRKINAEQEARGRVVIRGRVPDDATVDVLARRIASGALGGEGGADLSVYDGFLRGGEADAR